jgi:hypothetical protein
MDSEMIKAMAAELAAKVNKLINIPFIKEKDEQAFFELIILMVLDLVLSKLGSADKK